jgi:ferritin
MGTLSAVTLSLLQEQYRHEISNALRYRARSSWARFRGFESTADFFAQEAKGEERHAAIVLKWIEDRNEALVPEPLTYTESSEYASFEALFQTALAIELETTRRLTIVYATALSEMDAQLMMQVSELVIEQTEEENLYRTILDRIESRSRDAASSHDIDVWIGGRFVK